MGMPHPQFGRLDGQLVSLRWSKKGPLSLKPLSSWYLDILERVRLGRRRRFPLVVIGSLFGTGAGAGVKEHPQGWALQESWACLNWHVIPLDIFLQNQET